MYNTRIMLLNLPHSGLGGWQAPFVNMFLVQINVLPPFWARLHLRVLLRDWEFHERKEKRMWNTLTPDPQVVLQLDQGPQEAQEESRRGGAKWDVDEIAKLSLTLSIALTE